LLNHEENVFEFRHAVFGLVAAVLHFDLTLDKQFMAT
jgi:hypothetical protein